jgi:hypothetical protein
VHFTAENTAPELPSAPPHTNPPPQVDPAPTLPPELPGPGIDDFVGPIKDMLSKLSQDQSSLMKERLEFEKVKKSFKKINLMTVLLALAALPFGALGGIVLGCSLFGFSLAMGIGAGAICGFVLTGGLTMIVRAQRHRSGPVKQASAIVFQLMKNIELYTASLNGYFSDPVKLEALAKALLHPDGSLSPLRLSVQDTLTAEQQIILSNIIYAYQVVQQSYQTEFAGEIKPEVISSPKRQELIAKLDPQLAVVKQLQALGLPAADDTPRVFLTGTVDEIARDIDDISIGNFVIGDQAEARAHIKVILGFIDKNPDYLEAHPEFEDICTQAMNRITARAGELAQT